MGWSLGYDGNWNRDIGYGVPAYCDHPDCSEEIDRGLAHVCGSEPYGGEHGCGLYFCQEHLTFHETNDGDAVSLCTCCLNEEQAFGAKPDHPKWVHWKLTHESWQPWREQNPVSVQALLVQLEGM